MPGVYRVFHFGQTASRQNNTPMVGTTVQPSHKPPHKRKKLSWKKEPQEGGGGGGEGKLAGKNLVAEQRCWKKTPRATESVRGLVNYRECAHLPRTTPINYICSKNRLFCSARHKQSRQNFEVSKKTQLPCQALS